MWVCSRQFCSRRPFLRWCRPRFRDDVVSGVKWRHFGAPERKLSQPNVWKPVGLTLTIGCCSFSVAAVVHYERHKLPPDNWRKKLRLDEHTFAHTHRTGIYQRLVDVWKHLSELQKVAVGIIAVNTCIYLLWQVPSFSPFMVRWFMASPLAGSSVTLLTSAFSHMNFWHLFLNMYVFWSFLYPLERFMSAESFLAFYVTAGAASGLASHLAKVLRSSLSPSLGASGALLAIVGMVCFAMPDLKLQVVFLPFFTISAGKGLLALMGIDLAGLLLRWQFFDHAGHLGGVLFGCWYLLYGEKALWKSYRTRIVEAWKAVTQQK
ncbi:presenilin-associated rhomboid-like protein, mitochondrial [Corticium candelabrum]|uniref:presenilin-associated rhomboid-like protein, mitochondrial n=1 Tax=Corticium candelabrum TaxID=121492 RepID=UPI002E2659C4|nr:presenilin-associated rhomboid-like protein, mitochondrial [Corticium candelabrum]